MRKYLCLLPLLLSACGATAFQGEAHFPGGATSCQQKCGLQGLEMAGLVYMGEYSSACLCQVPGNNGQAARAGSVATVGAVAAVMQRMREDANASSMITTMILLGTITGTGVGFGG